MRSFFRLFSIYKPLIAACSAAFFLGCVHSPSLRIQCANGLLLQREEGERLNFEYCARQEIDPNGQGKWVGQGPSHQFYKDGKIQCAGQLLNGKKEGHWTCYHPNGVVSAQLNFHQGLKEGKTEIYSSDNKIEGRNQWHHGMLDGEQKFYDSFGKIKAIQDFSQGMANGRLQYFSSDGRLIFEGYYKNNMRNGCSREWNETNNGWNAQECYKDDQLIKVSQ